MYRAAMSSWNKSSPSRCCARPTTRRPKRFAQEAQSASSVNHNNVVGISDFGGDPGHAYLVMEFPDGETLTDLVNRGPTEPVRVCRIGAQIARGLQAVQ